MGSPGSRERCFRTCTRSSTAQGSNASRANDAPDVAFRTVPQRRHPGFATISRLNTWPARTPVNASAMTLLPSPHDSGPVWFAKPSPYDSFIHYTFPVLTGALGTLLYAVILFTLRFQLSRHGVRGHPLKDGPKKTRQPTIRLSCGGNGKTYRKAITASFRRMRAMVYHSITDNPP